MAVPRMYRVRQSFHRDRLADIPAGVRAAMSKGSLPIKRGDTVAVGAGSRGIANIAVIVRAVVDHLKDLGAKPFVFPAMGSHGGATAEGQLEILAHYGITEAAMGCPLRASMDVVQAGDALGMPVWCDRIASEADWIGIVNRVKPHTDFKGSIESGLFKMMTIGLGKYRGATQYHQANVTHGYETVITAVGREMLAKARITTSRAGPAFASPGTPSSSVAPLLLPRACLVDLRGDQADAWVVEQPTSTLSRRHLKLAGIENDRASVVDGLRPGDRVVISPSPALSEGAKVAPSESTQP